MVSSSLWKEIFVTFNVLFTLLVSNCARLEHTLDFVLLYCMSYIVSISLCIDLTISIIMCQKVSTETNVNWFGLLSNIWFTETHRQWIINAKLKSRAQLSKTIKVDAFRCLGTVQHDLKGSIFGHRLDLGVQVFTNTRSFDIRGFQTGVVFETHIHLLNISIFRYRTWPNKAFKSLYHALLSYPRNR